MEVNDEKFLSLWQQRCGERCYHFIVMQLIQLKIGDVYGKMPKLPHAIFYKEFPMQMWGYL